MKSILSNTEFQKILRFEKVILFVEVEWSRQAKLSAMLIEEWERTWDIWNQGLAIPIYRVDPDKQVFVSDWLSKHNPTLASDGNGAIIWLREGLPIDHDAYVAGAGIREIAQRTTNAFED